MLSLVEQWYVFPDEIIERQSHHPLLRGLHICRAGFFPNFNNYITSRPEGLPTSHIIIYCTKGKGWFESEGQRWTIVKGQVLFVLKDVPHVYGPIESDSWSIQWAHFNGNEVETFLEWMGITSQSPLLTVGEDLQIIRLFNEILNACQFGYSLTFLLNSATLLRQILSLLVLHQNASTFYKKEVDVEQSIQFMLNHLAKKLTIKQLAVEANLSQSQFVRQFQTQTGYSPIDYFIRLKMQKACELLSSTELQIQEVAFSLGYADPYYFSRSFKRVVGVSPRAYRQSNKYLI